MSKPRTLYEKIYDRHVVVPGGENPDILYIDLHLVHEVTSPQAFDGLRRRGIKVRRPERTLGTVDHSIPTLPAGLAAVDEAARAQMDRFEDNCREFGIECYGRETADQGIVHVIGPESGATRPGQTIVCGDSHTATHGAFGALAFGIGTTEVEHVLATQCLLQRRARPYRVNLTGRLQPGTGAKDLILALLAKIGTAGGTGCVLEYTGETVRTLSMEERMTICNMSIEAGARAGLMAPDDTTFQYLAGRPRTPRGDRWDEAVRSWKTLESDDEAVFFREVMLDAAAVEPMITFGTSPGMAMAIGDPVPEPAAEQEPAVREALARALEYMGISPGKSLLGHKIDVVFVGSCTNGRISDLREAAAILAGRRVADGVRMLVVPGSRAVKRQAEAEGLDLIFQAAGAEWREPGCSMCIAMNGDEAGAGQYCVSTSNRNFEGRQGAGSRTILAGPGTAAAAAVQGKVADPRAYLRQPVEIQTIET